MVSTMVARVVDLPLPVGPVTRISPWVLLIRSRQIGRQSQLLEGVDLVGNLPDGHGRNAALLEHVGPETADALDAEGKIEFLVVLEALLLFLVEDTVGQTPGLVPVQDGELGGHDLAVDPELGRQPCREVEIAGTLLATISSRSSRIPTNGLISLVMAELVRHGGFAQHFLDSGDPLGDLDHAIVTQGQHALLDGLVSESPSSKPGPGSAPGCPG